MHHAKPISNDNDLHRCPTDPTASRNLDLAAAHQGSYPVSAWDLLEWQALQITGTQSDGTHPLQTSEIGTVDPNLNRGIPDGSLYYPNTHVSHSPTGAVPTLSDFSLVSDFAQPSQMLRQFDVASQYSPLRSETDPTMPYAPQALPSGPFSSSDMSNVDCQLADAFLCPLVSFLGGDGRNRWQ